jgi:ABC-2 type transport system ATP-binding protein
MTVTLTGVGKRYRRNWALRDCSVSVPTGRVVALVGPNGAGKTTLLHIIVGLLAAEEGNVTVLGRPAGTRETLPRIDWFSVADMLRFGAHMNPRWDASLARTRLASLEIPMDRKVGRLSGGQRAQVALTVALAKRPDLLVLDEPLANLDPLARHDVMRGLMAAVAESGMTVVLSSHVVSDLEDTCDWLVVLNGGRVQVSGDIEDLLASHRLLTGPVELADTLPLSVVDDSRTDRQATLLVHSGESPLDPRWTSRGVGLEELVLAYLRRPDSAALPRPVLA